MKKYILALLLAVSVTGCASLNPLAMLNPAKPSIEVSANIGKNVEQNKSNIRIESGKTEQKADVISNDTTYTADVVNQVTERIPPWILAVLILFAGWVIPSPKECFIGLKCLTSDLLNGIVVTPIKGLANFILTLFGREKL